MTHGKRRLLERIQGHAETRGIALEHGSRLITYQALAESVRERAAELSGVVPRGGFTGLERRRSPEFVVDFLAVLALDGVAVPIDPDLPAGRRRTLLDALRPAVLLGESTTVLDGRGAAAADDGAYVFFTSGSTGRPKPVLGSAAALVAFLEWQCGEFGIGPGDRVGFLTALGFDVVVREMFLALWAGGTLVIPSPGEAAAPEETVEWLARADVGVVNVVPSVARRWVRHATTTHPGLHTVFFAGEPPAGALLEEWHPVFPGTRVRVDFYGTTETTLPKVYRRLPRAGTAPAGRPVPGADYRLIDPARPLAAALDGPRSEGEIVLVSAHNGHGYVGMPEETGARFADLGGGVTAYRTGDLGRVDDDGGLVVKGRTDDEFKINGVRIQPAEVAAAIRADDLVSEAYVAFDADGDRRLTAYVVPTGANAAGLRARLLAELPPAMVPARIVELAALPALPNGKVDRLALRALGAGPRPAQDFVAPSGDTELWLAGQWADLFGGDSYSSTDDFLALGGDSIAAMQLAARIDREFGVALPVRAILSGATIAAIAERIADQQFAAIDPAELRALLDEVEDGPADTLVWSARGGVA